MNLIVKLIASAGVMVGAILPTQVSAIDLEYLQGQMPSADKSVTAYGDDMFGDKLSMYDGSLQFEHTDLQLKGNNELLVALTRGVSVGKHESVAGHSFQLGDWAWKLPRLGGAFSHAHGWVGSDGSGARCSKFSSPTTEFVGTPLVDMFALDYWHGTFIEIPGQGSQEVQGRDPAYTHAPVSGGPYPLVTKQQWQIGCLSTTQNGSGEGFYAVSPTGVRYDFDWYAVRATDTLKKGHAILLRDDIYLYASKATDRFGNWVKYTYDPANPNQLQKIESSDGRVITVANSGGLAQSASDGTRTVDYAYNGTTLSTVTLPDGRQWQFNINTLYPPSILGQHPTDACDDGSTFPTGPSSFTGSIKHPSGATATFTAQYVVLYRESIQAFCNISNGVAMYDTLPAHVGQVLTSKQISGPGLTPMLWTFELADVADHLPTCASSTCSYRVNKVTGPDGFVARHFYGDTWHVNEGQHLGDQLGWDGTNAAQTTVYTYRSNIGQVFPEQFGSTYIDDPGDWFSARLDPVDSVTVYQQGEVFSNVVNQFDAFARSVQVTKSGPGGSRTETTAYADNNSLWVLGQVQSVTSGADTLQSNGFNAMAQPNSHSEFGVPKYTRSYNADGTLASETDNLNHTTSFGSYMRGLPQTVTYPTGARERAVVNNLGLFTSYTNAAGDTDPASYTTTFSYDSMGRLASITPPTGWNGTTLTFEPIPYAEYDLPADHYRLTVSHGDARTINYYDAMWRPVMTRTFDNTDEANTRKVVVKSYAPNGKPSFESYPERNFNSVTVLTPGKRSVYDAMGRVTHTEADSELGTLTTNTEFLSGFLTRTTNPRGKQSTQGFWALDNPGEALLGSASVPAGAGLPNGMNLSINRDNYGKATSITRGDGSVNVTRSYVYDANQRLCKTLEPEVIATVQAYDDAGNVAWRAPGVNLPTAACDRDNVPASAKISYAYNELNMLTTTSYGDSSPTVTRDYWLDGKLKTVSTSDGSSWSYAYNNLRLLTSETLMLGSQNYGINWTYDAQGHRSSLTYPASGPAVTYSTNALGEDRAVSGYASAVSYQPNGAVAGYTLANTVVHTQTQNVRGLPLVNTDAGVMQDQYTYDENGNVTAIADLQENISNRTMSYDDLDRLATANAPNVWGNATYAYDAVDNLRASIVGSRVSTLTYDGTNKLASIVTNGNTSNYSYDANGNISSKGGQTFAFDLGNRLKASSIGGGYQYDGHGRRTRVLALNGSNRVQVYSMDGQLLWAEQHTQPAITNYSCSSGTLSGSQCVSTSTYAGTPTAYSCNAGDTLSGGTCTHITNSTYAGAVTSYSCNAGDALSGSTCTHNTNSSYTASIASYSCTAGDSLSGSTCTHVATNTYGAAIASYSCNAGDSLSGSSCTHTASNTYGASVASYSCNAGDALSGSTCTHTTTTAATPVYSCPATYTLSGSTCTKTTTAAATPAYSCNGLGSPALSGGAYYCTGQTAPAPDETYDQKCGDNFSGYGLAYVSGVKQGVKLTCTYQAQTTYSCPGGGTVSGSQCVTTSTQAASISNYSCSAGTVSGSNCVATNTYGASIASYSCNAGDALSGSTCTHTASSTYGASVASYSCTPGDSLSGSTCTHSVSSTYGASAATYSCSSGDTLSGSTCTHTAGSTYTATAATFSCSAGDSLSGSTCTHSASSTYGGTPTAYSCTAGDALNGSTCSHTSTAAATPVYGCSSGTYSGGNCVGGTAQSSTAYIYLGTKQIAEWDSVNGNQFAHTDALGSPVAYTNTSGTVMNRTRFEAYGYPVAGVKPSPNTSVIGFTGHVQDAETDLVYMQQRYYDPLAGRFLSVDPVQTEPNTGARFGRYVYASNSPYKFIDPNGQSDLNLFPSDDPAYAAGKAFYIPGMFTITGHGSTTVIQTESGSKVGSIHATEFLQNRGLKEGQPLFVGACNIGSGGGAYAQAMADGNKSWVIAADGFVFYPSTKSSHPYLPFLSTTYKAGDPVTLTVNSKPDGKGARGSFHIFTPGGSGMSSTIRSITFDSATGQATMRMDPETGSKIGATILIGPEQKESE